MAWMDALREDSGRDRARERGDHVPWLHPLRACLKIPSFKTRDTTINYGVYPCMAPLASYHNHHVAIYFGG